MEYDKESIEPYVKFINNWHYDTINNKKAMRNEDGSVTTVNAVGIPLGDKIYLVPTYLRDGKTLSESEAYSYWKNKIPKLEKEGLIEGIPDVYTKDIKKHPANIIAEQNHVFMDEEGKSLDTSALGFDYYKGEN